MPSFFYKKKYIKMDYLLRTLAFAIMPKPLPPLHLYTYKISKKVSDDTHNHIPKGDISCKIHTRGGTLVGEFNYRSHNGQVGGMYLSENYRHRTLEQQMLVYMMKDMQDAGAKEIWEVINKETKAESDALFYSILWDFRYKKSHVHPSVTGPGYIMEIPKDLRTLLITPGLGKYADN